MDVDMAKHQIKKIFEPFYSSKNSNSNWGMGLYYVREIVKSHLGFMRVDVPRGKEAVFTFYCQNTNNCTLNFSYRSDKE